MSVAIILGSARADGNTRDFVERIVGGRSASVLDLSSLQIEHYEYGPNSSIDDFERVTELLFSHQKILFATPVYWYAMSGRMKVVFDRLTDLLVDPGPLKGREVYLAATGTKPELPEGFEVPFRDTAEYLGMVYRRTIYACVREETGFPSDLESAIEEFARDLFGA